MSLLAWLSESSRGSSVLRGMVEAVTCASNGGEGTATGNEQHRNEDLTVTSREQKEGGGREGVESLEK